MAVSHVAVVGVAGGAGTTRTVLELAAVLARGGQSALVFDLDFATQGLERFVHDSLDPDAARLLADPGIELAEAVNDIEVEGPGRLGLVPAFAPFSTIAEAKAPEAGARVGTRLREAAETVDHVLLDVPPVVSNQAVGGVTAAERVVATIPPSERGVDALQREKGRLADVGTGFDAVLAVDSSPAEAPPDATATIPHLPSEAPPYQPVALNGDGQYTAAVSAVAADLFDVDLGDSIEAGGSVFDAVKERIENRR